MDAVNFPIDIVLPWVDGSDIDWQEKKKNMYLKKRTMHSVIVTWEH